MMGLSSAYSGPGGQNVREQQGGYSYNSPASASGGSSSSGTGTADIFRTLFGSLGNLTGNPFFGLGLNFLGNMYTNMQNRRAVNRTNRLNYQMQQEQLAWNERMWHMNNEYNTPANQMKRLIAAGLNPDLMYGNPSQGTSSSPAQGTNPAQAQAFQSLGFGDMFSNAQQLMMQKKANDANVRLMQAQADSLDAETTLKERGLSLDEKRVKLQEQELQSSIDQFEKMMPYYEAQIDKIKSDKKVSDEQADEIFWRNLINSRTYGYQMERLQAELDKIKSEYNLNSKQAYYYTQLAEQCIQGLAMGEIELSHAGIKDWYETKMMENDWIMSEHDKKVSSRRTWEYRSWYMTAMRYLGALTGAVGNVFGGNASYQLNPTSRTVSKPSIFTKLRF